MDGKKPRSPTRNEAAAPRAYHHGALREALTRAALALIAEQGVRGFTLREVARRVGVSHAASYRHFADKRALLTALATEGMRLLAERIEAALAAAGADARQRFLSAGYAYVRFAADEPGLFAAMYSEDIDLGDEGVIAAKARSFGVLLAFIERSQSEGLIVAGDARALAVPVWAMHHGLATLAINGAFREAPSLKAVVDDAHARLLDGLFTPPRKPSSKR